VGKLYSAKEISNLIGVTSQTIIDWESKSWIPQSTRVGLRRKRIWSGLKVQQILEFARDTAGYPVPDRILEQVIRSD
jgi:transposase